MKKIYSKAGDLGFTLTGTEEKIPKDSPHLSACGITEELNSLIGVAMSLGVTPEIIPILIQIQSDLFSIGTEISSISDTSITPVGKIEPQNIKTLEEYIDKLSESLSEQSNYILPGGSLPGSILHLAKNFCRRVERSIVSLHQTHPVNESILQYFNRLSDLMYVMARFQNRQDGVEETEWSGKRQ